MDERDAARDEKNPASAPDAKTLLIESAMFARSLVSMRLSKAIREATRGPSLQPGTHERIRNSAKFEPQLSSMQPLVVLPLSRMDDMNFVMSG